MSTLLFQSEHVTFNTNLSSIISIDGKKCFNIFNMFSSLMLPLDINWSAFCLAHVLKRECNSSISSSLSNNRSVSGLCMVGLLSGAEQDLAEHVVAIARHHMSGARHIKNLGLRHQAAHFRYARIVDDIADCYRALGLIHRRWPMVPGLPSPS